MGEWISANITLPLSATASDEKENAYSHFLGLLLSVIGFMAVIASSQASGHPASRTGMIVFAISNIVLYAASGFYHFLKPGLGKKAMRILDHSCIYLLIAGSYTPILLYAGTPLAEWYTAGIWIAAAAGIILTIRFWGKLYALHIALYIAMGWSVMAIYDELVPALPPCLIPYMVTGGIIYTAGVVFYAAKRIAHHHLIWHIFVLAGSISFFIGYSSCLLA